MMVLKKLITILSFILLYQCGYSAIYKDNKNTEFKIIVLEIEGNKDINNKINFKLKKHFNNESDREFKITMNTKLNKNVISKNLKGDATNYELTAVSVFNVNYKDKTQIISLKENIKIKNIDDSFEQRKYENEVMENFASSIYDRLIMKLELIE